MLVEEHYEVALGFVSKSPGVYTMLVPDWLVPAFVARYFHRASWADVQWVALGCLFGIIGHIEEERAAAHAAGFGDDFEEVMEEAGEMVHPAYSTKDKDNLPN